MTIEEKRNALKAACESHHPYCYSNGECPLYGLGDICFDEDNIERDYEIVFGKEADKTEDIVRTGKLMGVPENIMLHATVCDELKDLYQRKNTDYGDSFHKTFIEEGMAMARIRLSDKMERFKRLTKSGEQNVKDESIRDTLIDLANYAIMTIVEMEREKHD